jgi:type IV secretion system protein VirB1
MNALAFVGLVAACAPGVDITTAQAVVAAESSFNAHAIGVVSGSLERQPRSRGEGVATAKRLQAVGWNYSVGLAQINVRNFKRLGLTAESAFDPCVNLGAMQVVLTECFERAARRGADPQHSLRQALSCYYSGNFVTGFEHAYVRRVARAAFVAAARPLSPASPAKDLP